jgi:hypothetical protein
VQLGGEVGYSVRFEDCTCKETRIKYLTGKPGLGGEATCCCLKLIAWHVSSVVNRCVLSQMARC